MLRPDCGSLVEDYEAVRQEALECGGRAVHGRALLRFKGMASFWRATNDTSRNRSSMRKADRPAETTSKALGESASVQAAGKRRKRPVSSWK